MSKKFTTEEIIEKANKVHEDKYDYSLIDYINQLTKIKIICPEHGIFEQTPNNHINNKQGCFICSLSSRRPKNTTKDFIEMAQEIHGDKYDYSLCVYTGKFNKVIIINKKYLTKHSIRADSHIKQKAECSLRNAINKTEFLIKEFKTVHGDRYDYSKVIYLDIKKYVEIICPENNHGSFLQTPDNHKQGRGCSICMESKGEKEIKNYLIENNITFIREHKYPECRDKLPLPFDFYLPEHNTCIEFNGKQHYEWSKKFYHSTENDFKSQLKRDKIKMRYCQNNNISLIIIKYDESIENKLNLFFNRETIIT